MLQVEGFAKEREGWSQKQQNSLYTINARCNKSLFLHSSLSFTNITNQLLESFDSGGGHSNEYLVTPPNARSTINAVTLSLVFPVFSSKTGVYENISSK